MVATQVIPHSYEWAPNTTDITDRILGSVSVSPRSGRYLASLFPSVDTAVVVGVLSDLQAQRILQLDSSFNYCLAPASATATYIPSLKDLTLQIPIGVLRDLKRYAKSQGTSVEMEASHLLSEIVRVYKAQSVIPNT